MPHLGPAELIIILLIVIAIFGAGKLATLGGALGRGVRDFRAAVRDNDEGSDEDGGSSKPKAAKAESPAASQEIASHQS